VVKLADLAKIYLSQQRASIRHEAGKRRQVITCNVSGRGVTDFVDELRGKVNAAGFLPKGVYAVFTGAAEAEATSHLELMLATGLTLLIIGVFLSMVFRRRSHFLLVVSILPFAVAGGVYAIVISGIVLSLGALIGFITLLGLSVRNSIMLMTHYDHLMKEERCEWSLEAAIRGASERVVPVLMTTVVTGLALLPLAISPDTAGREVEGPMAIVILGGLISSTIVTLLVLPVAAWRFGRWNHLADEETDEWSAG
jgi:Cu/Ag efflux pump CusA